MQYMISSKEKPANHPFYVVHSDLDSFELFNSDCPNVAKIFSDVEEERDNALNSKILGNCPGKKKHKITCSVNFGRSK